MPEMSVETIVDALSSMMGQYLNGIKREHS